MTPEDGRDVDDRNTVDDLRGNNFNASDNVGNLLGDVRLHGTDDDVFAACVPPPPFVEQLEGLAYSGGIPKKDFQFAALRRSGFGLHLAKECLWVGTFGV
jgi:hypothetical protein